MILEDDDPHGTKASKAAPHAPALGDSSAPINRDHVLLDAEAALDAPPSYDETTSLLPFRPVPRARDRFARAFLAALLVWALVSAFFGNWAGQRFRKSADAPIPSARPRDPPPTPPSTQCIAASEWTSQDFKSDRHLAHHTFTLNRDADVLHLISLSSFRGTVTIIGVNSLEQILVDVFGVATSRDRLDRTEVCVFENATGLSVRATDGESALATLSISVRLPRHPTEIWGYGALRTHLPMFEHYLEDLVGLTFQHVDIYSFAAPVRVPYITVRNISIQATDAPVTGFFNVSQELSLKTSNGAISGHVDLWSTSDHANTSLAVSNHEAPITLDINLRSAAPSGRGGQFLISAETTRGSSEMNVHSAPIDSRLDLDASTRHGVNRVKLPAAFEGLFSLRRQSADEAVLELREYDFVRDPAGEGRFRELMYDYEDGVGFEGSIAWLPRHQHAVNGSVRMLTMDADGTLLC